MFLQIMITQTFCFIQISTHLWSETSSLKYENTAGIFYQAKSSGQLMDYESI